MTLSGRMVYFLARSLATKQGRIYVYGERKLELELDLEVLFLFSVEQQNSRSRQLMSRNPSKIRPTAAMVIRMVNTRCIQLWQTKGVSQKARPIDADRSKTSRPMDVSRSGQPQKQVRVFGTAV